MARSFPGKNWYRWKEQKWENRGQFFFKCLVASTFNPSKHTRLLWQNFTKMCNRPSVSPYFLSAGSFFSRIFHRQPASGNISRIVEKCELSRFPKLFRRFTKCLHYSLRFAKKDCRYPLDLVGELRAEYPCDAARIMHFWKNFLKARSFD